MLVILTHNFDFNQKHYLQIGGTAMGTGFASLYSSTFMVWFEDTFVYNYLPSPQLLKRYIDDIFVVWTHGYQAFKTCVHYLEECMPSINQI